MDTPLPVLRAKRAGRWLRRVAACILLGCLGGSAAGCQGFGEPAAPAPNQVAGSGVTQAKKESSFFSMPDMDWEWEDFDYFGWLPQAAPPSAPPEAYVLKGDKLTQVKTPEATSLEARMALAHERFRMEDYAKAEKIFHRIADHEKNPPKMVQEAKFFEAECLRLQDRLPKAADTYTDLMNKFPRNQYRDQVLAQMYKIANFWLEETRQQMQEEKEKEEGKRWIVMPRFVNWTDPKIPLLDREGRALQLLEAVRFGDINGPLADQALFLCGSVKFFDEDYKDADYYFTQVSEKKDSKLVETAMRLAIISKHMSTGGPDYDGRKVAEARILVDKALNNYPNIDRKFLTDQLVDITKQQSEKDFLMADFYQRTGHPGAAVFYYDLVVRRYPGTESAKEAAKRRDEIRQKIEQEKLVEPPAKMPAKATAPVEQAPAPRVLPPDIGTPGR